MPPADDALGAPKHRRFIQRGDIMHLKTAAIAGAIGSSLAESQCPLVH